MGGVVIDDIKVDLWQGLMGSARHVIKLIHNPRFLIGMTPFEKETLPRV